MTSAHFLYIPLVALAGLVLGFIWGRKAALDEFEAKQRRAAEQEARRAERRAKRRNATKDDSEEPAQSV